MKYVEITTNTDERLVLGVLQDGEIDVSFNSGCSKVINMRYLGSHRDNKTFDIDILIKLK